MCLTIILDKALLFSDIKTPIPNDVFLHGLNTLRLILEQSKRNPMKNCYKEVISIRNVFSIGEKLSYIKNPLIVLIK